MFALLFVFTIFVCLSAAPLKGFVQLKAFPHSKLVADWEFGGDFAISKNYFKQRVSVAFDLEYPYQFLYDANYVDINNWPTSSFHDYYRPQDSSSYATQNRTFQLKFDGDTQNIKTSINGIWASDTISQFFDKSSSTYDNCGFGLIQGGDSFQDSAAIFAYTGRLGMSLNGTGKSNWVIDAMKKDYDGLITFIVFDNSFYMGFGNDPSNDDNCDRTQLITESVTDTSKDLGKQHWQITTMGLQFGKYSFGTPQYVRFTLSSAYFYGPQDYVQKLYNLLNAYEDNDQWIVDCAKQTKGPVIEFKMNNGAKLQIQPSTYVLKDSQSGECYLAVREFSDSSNFNHWALGALFESTYCLTLDYSNQKIQFQPVKDANNVHLMSKTSAFVQHLSEKH